jgi:hypothetical protein
MSSESKVKLDEDFSDARKFALLNHIDGLLIFIRWGLILVTVLVFGSFIRSFVVQDQVEKVNDAANNALTASQSADNNSVLGRDAAIEVRDTLNEILAQLQQSEGTSNQQQVNNALQAIARIEAFLCNGVCPEPPE